MFHAAICRYLRVDLNGAIRCLLTICRSNCELVRISRLIVRVGSRLAADNEEVTTIRLRVSSPLLVLRSDNMVRVTRLSKGRILISVRLMMNSEL